MTAAPQTCPRCGDANECALPDGAASAAECWCAEVVMDPGLVAHYLGKAQCLCRRCAGAREDSGLPRS